MPKGAAETTRRRQEPLATGIAGLYEVLDGGFGRGGFYLVADPAGVRKTTLGDQFAYALAANGRVSIHAIVLTGDARARARPTRRLRLLSGVQES